VQVGGYMQDNELVEVTLTVVRIRKRLLYAHEHTLRLNRSGGREIFIDALGDRESVTRAMAQGNTAVTGFAFDSCLCYVPPPAL
jgi:hypothetical protein